MRIERSSGIELEFKDLDSSKRTAVIRHAVYTSIDKVQDISCKGMFAKSWKENKPDFLFNHVEGETVGSVKSMYEDDNGAYTEVKFGNWTKGNDVLEMASEGVLKGASYGYIADKKKIENVIIKGQKIRKLKEVKHIETSLLTVLPAHPEAGIISLTKSLEIKQLSQAEQTFLKNLLSNDMSNMQSLIEIAVGLDVSSDLYTWIMYQISRRADWADSIMSKLYWNAQQMKSISSHVETVEKFCHNAKASDETIQQLETSISEYKQLISSYDTATTHIANEPVASDDEIVKAIKMFTQELAIKNAIA